MSIKKVLKTGLALAYKNRATIATVSGMIFVGVGTANIISKAKQAADIAYEIEARLDDIHQRDAANDWESKKERRKETNSVLKFAAVEYTKTYALGVACVVGGEILQGFGYATKCQQLSTATAFAASYAATLNAVKERVIEDQGEEKWQEYLLGPQFTTVDVLPDGTVIQTTEPLANPNEDAGLPPHCFFFDEHNYNWEKDPIANRDFLEAHLRWLNDKLWAEGFLFENDIRRDLGEPIVKSGWTSGIFATDKDGNRNYISFGLDAKNPAAQRFRDGIEPSVLIQLNVEDNIIEQIKLPLI